MDSPTPEPPTPFTPNNKRPIPDFQYTASGKNKQKKSDPLVRLGGHFLRTVEMFVLPSQIITHGLAREAEMDEREAYTEEQNQMWDAWEKLTILDPTIYQRLESAQDIKETARLLQSGGSSAKSQDTNGIKDKIREWCSHLRPDSPSIPKKKEARGFNNDVTGQLLCPAVLDWDDPEVQRTLREGTAKVDGEPVSGANWPNFIYGGVFDKNLPWVGLFQGALLVNAFKHIFTSPSSNEHEHDENLGSSNATRSGNAQLNGMTSVTTGSIAYAATQVLFALSSRGAFHKNCKVLDAVTFYNSIIGYLHDPDNKLEVMDLLRWWNRRIFPQRNARLTTGRNSSRAQIKAARMAAAAAAEPEVMG